jgi:RNA polymerase sigma-70 factor (ECF subfamily)
MHWGQEAECHGIRRVREGIKCAHRSALFDDALERRAGRRGPPSPQSEEALEKLCTAYWYPLYAYVRRRGFSAEDAEDLTQAFFATLLEKGRLARADPPRGRFRTFLLSSLEHFLGDAHDQQSRQKRGGGQRLISWDREMAEERYRSERLEGQSPDHIFEKRWATTLLERVLTRLRDEFEHLGKAATLDQLAPHLWGDEEAVPYRQLEQELHASTGTLRVTVHRLRRRYRDLLRDEIAQTVADPAEVDEEIRHLMRVVAS